jgi:uncharacterized protein
MFNRPIGHASAIVDTSMHAPLAAANFRGTTRARRLLLKRRRWAHLQGSRMSDELTAEEIRSLLNLEPNATCGFARGTYVSGPSIAAGGLPPPFANQRPMGSALYFLVTPTAPVRLHRIRNDQLYHYYLGDPLEVFLLHANGSTERIIVGPDLRAGNRVQLLIPGNTFHTARVIGRRRWFLGASTEWPGVVPTDVEIGNVDEIAAKCPAIADTLRAIAASVAVH